MKRFSQWALVAFGVGLAMLMGGCERRVTPQTRPERTNLDPVGSDAGPVEPERILPKKKVSILVGGCGGDCADPALAVAGFLEALAREEDPDRVARYLDTTVLHVDGRDLGAQWVQMWSEMRAATRKDSIREVVRDLASWKEGLTDPQVSAALASGARPVRVWSTEAVYDWSVPGGAWRITLRPRGIEWLVTRVERRMGGGE